MRVTLYQICDVGESSGNRILAGLQPVERVIAATEGPLRAAMEQLLAGPTPEEIAAGFGSWFSSNTAGALQDASVTSDGLARFDLDGDIIQGLNNVSTSTGGDYFRGQLYGTALAFEEITSVVFMLDGNASGFCALMQLIPDCVPVSERQWSATYTEEYER